MASASAHIVLKDKVSKTKIARDGTAVVVKTIDNAQVEERFPKRRMRGKRKANDQMVPVEDVIRGMEDYAQTVEPEVQRRVDGVNCLANELLDTEIKKERRKSKATLKLANRMGNRPMVCIRLVWVKARTRFQAGKIVAAKRATSAARRVAGQSRQANQAVELAERAVQHAFRSQTFAENLARCMNEGV
jgi:hypothetical protein